MMMEMSSVAGDIDPEEQSMIRRVFEFRETTAGDVLVPLIDVVSVERKATCADARRLAVKTAHRVLVVHEGRVDRVVGILDTLDLLAANADQLIEPFVSPVRNVPSSQSIESLLVTLRRAGETVVVVVDEYGGAQGILTIEDIIEEVVGEIEDEHDRAPASSQWVRKLAKRDFLVNARIKVGALRDELGIVLPKGDYETLAGFLTNMAAEIPTAGQVIRYKKYSFMIEQATDRAIQEVRIRW